MKKTFLYVMMAATALFTCTMTSCSDDDDTKNNEAEEAMIDDINQCIMNNFLVMGTDSLGNTVIRKGLYGVTRDAADATSFICQVADAEAAVKFFNNLMPDSMVSKVKVDGQKRTLSYTQEGKQYTMTYAPATGENIATITLPNVDIYNKYARTVQLRDHVSDNATAAEFQQQYQVGDAYQLGGCKLYISAPKYFAYTSDKYNNGELYSYDEDYFDRYMYTTNVDYAYDNDDEYDDDDDDDDDYSDDSEEPEYEINLPEAYHSPYYYCVYNNGTTAMFVYVPNDHDIVYRKDHLRDTFNKQMKVYPIEKFTTNQCYDKRKDGGLNELLPTSAELKALYNNFPDFVNAYNRRFNKNLNPRSVASSLISIFDRENSLQLNAATCETKNGLFSRKQVKYVSLASGEEEWMNKNHTNMLDVVYIRILTNVDESEWVIVE